MEDVCYDCNVTKINEKRNLFGGGKKRCKTLNSSVAFTLFEQLKGQFTLQLSTETYENWGKGFPWYLRTSYQILSENIVRKILWKILHSCKCIIL